MNKEELIKEIKKSRKQNTNERYEYINSHFNQTNYAISLEKYVKELLKENKILRENAEHNDKVVDNLRWENRLLHNKIDKAIKYINKHRADGGYLDIQEVKELLEILKDSDVDE